MKQLACRMGLVFAAAFGLLLFAVPGSHAQTGNDLTRVRFGMLPYADHTYAIIGVQKGWFKEVGIDLQYDVIRIEQVVPFLENGSYDVISTHPDLLLTGYEDAPDLGMFVLGDLFQGFAIMAQPNRGYKSVQEFEAAGMPPGDAIRAAVAQMRGKTFAYPPESGVKPFIDLVLDRGGLKAGDYHPMVVDDPQTVTAMRRGDADFEVGGAPSRIVLQREGFKPIVRAVDLARAAKASPDSPELAAILPGGWGTTKRFYSQKHDVVLRLASVSFRITQFMNDHQAEALAIHMPFLSRVTGESFTPADGKIIYDDLDPFMTFDQQKPWFSDANDPLYYKNWVGAHVKSFVDAGTYSKHVPTVDDVIWAADVYHELVQLRDEAQSAITRITTNQAQLKPPERAKLADAQHFFAIFDYYDADRLTKELESANR